MEKYIVKKQENGSYQIYETIERMDITEQPIMVLENKGVFELPTLYQEKARLEEMVTTITEIITLIENAKLAE
jgi:hypothetical protein